MLIFCSASGQQVIYVKQDASGNNNGRSWDHAYTDLQVALYNSSEGDELWIAEGTYYPTKSNDRNASFHIKSRQKWYGGFQGTEVNEKQRRISRHPTILSGNIGNRTRRSDNAYTIITAIDVDTSTLLNGIDIVEGYANGSSGNNIHDLRGSAAGIYISTENAEITGVKIEQVDFLRNYANGYGAAMVIAGKNGGKAMIYIDICFYYSNKAGKNANLIYAEQLAEDIQHKILDSQIRSGEIASSASEIILNMSGNNQELLFKSNISGNIISAGSNRFLDIINSADQLELEIIDNQLYSSHLDRGIEVTNQGGKVQFNFHENDILDLTHMEGEEDYVLNFKNDGQGEIHAQIIENDFIRNHVTSLINGSELSSLSMESNLMMRNQLIGSAVMLRATNQSLPDVYTTNGVFTYNEGPLFLLDQNGHSSGDWKLTNCTFLSNFTQVTNYDFLGTDTKALMYFLSENQSLLSINNSIFYHENGENQPLIYLKNSTLNFNNNLIQFNQCDDLVIKDGNGSLSCHENVFNSNPILLNLDGRDVQLASCSPAIDIGNESYATEAGVYFDYRNGGQRVQGHNIDAGAVEHAAYSEEQKKLCVLYGDKIEVPDYGEKPYEYSWTNHLGIEGNGIGNLEPGYYLISVTDQIGCPFNVELNLYEEGRFNFTNYDISKGVTFCDGEAVTLESPPHYQVTWPDGSNGDTYTTSEIGPLTIEVKNECISEEYTVELWAYSPQLKNKEVTLCGDDILTLSWREVTEPGTYYDTLKNQIGCDSLITEYLVSRSQREEVSIEGNLTICPDEESLINIVGGNEYLWDSGSLQSSRWLAPGTHYAEVIDNNGCIHELAVDIDTYDNPDWIQDSIITKQAGETITIAISDDSGTIISISPDVKEITFMDHEITFNNNSSGEFEIQILYGDGCVAYENLRIEVPFNEKALIQVSNVLSTTSDQAMKLYSDPSVQILSLKVFDRWGMKVYEQQTGWHQPVSDGWNGSIGNSSVPSGVYVWLLEYIYEGKKLNLTGDITVIH